MGTKSTRRNKQIKALAPVRRAETVAAIQRRENTLLFVVFTQYNEIKIVFFFARGDVRGLRHMWRDGGMHSYYMRA